MVMLENNPAHVEHINQIIYNNKEFDMWYCFDTAELLRQHPKFGRYDSNNPGYSKITTNVIDVRYDFLLVNIINKGSHYVYRFDVRNTLWDGKYRISHSMRPDEPHQGVVVTKDSEDPNILEINIDSHNLDQADLRVCFHMTQKADSRSIDDNCIIINNESYYSDPCSQNVKHKGHVYISGTTCVDTYDSLTPCPNCNIKLEPCDVNGNIINGGLLKQEDLSNNKGEYNITYSKVKKPGDYYVKLTAFKEVGVNNTLLTATQIVKVNKYQDCKIGVDLDNIGRVYKGEKHLFTINCGLENKLGVIDPDRVNEIKGLTASITVKFAGTSQTCSCTIDEKGQISGRINFRHYYGDTAELSVTIPDQGEFPQSSAKKTIKLDWYYADTPKDIIDTCKDENATDFIMIKAKDYDMSTDRVVINRDMTLCGVQGKNWATLIGRGTNQNNTNSILSIRGGNSPDGKVQVHLVGLKFKNGNNAIYMYENTDLRCYYCYFLNNMHPSLNNKGSSIFNVVNERTKKESKHFKNIIDSCYFYNNFGNEICVCGNTNITNCLFVTNEANKLVNPEPKVLEIYNGATTYKNNKSHIKVYSTVYTKNHAWAKLLCYVGERGSFNGATCNMLQKPNTLPVFGEKWGNQAYTYALYYYPHFGINHNISATPHRGRERTSTGHVGYRSKPYMFAQPDGYNLIRYYGKRSGTNTYDPWTKKELAMPGNLAIFDSKTGAFTGTNWPWFKYTNTQWS